MQHGLTSLEDGDNAGALPMFPAIALDAAWIRSAWFHQASFAGWFSRASARGLLTLQREQAAS